MPANIKRSTKKNYFIAKAVFFILFFLLVNPPAKVSAQITNLGIANTYTVVDKEKEDGDIVSLAAFENQLTLSRKDYDEKMFGVIVESPILVFRTTEYDTPVLRWGEAAVNITTLNGPIATGDYITSSPVPGKGQKATEISGYILGTALSSFEEKDGTPLEVSGKRVSAGKVKVAIGIGPASPVIARAGGGIFGALARVAGSFFFSIKYSKQTERIVRYFLAGLVAMSTILINFNSFGRNITKGIESIGRNPLAKIYIQTMIVFNMVLIAIISLGGILLSLAIISL